MSTTAPVAGRLAIGGTWLPPRADFDSTNPANLGEVIGRFKSEIAAADGLLL